MIAILMFREGVIKKVDFLGTCPQSGGGVRPPSIIRSRLFSDKEYKYSACPEKRFFVKQFFCIVTPSLSTGSNEIFTYKKKIFLFFYPLS